MTTLEKLQAHLAAKRIKHGGIAMPVPRIHCQDGFSVSIQASEFAYSEPSNNTGPWTQMEVGYPDAAWDMPDTFQDYYDSGQVWAYVPAELICNLIDSHGGIKE